MLLQASDLRIPLQGESSPLLGPVDLSLAEGDRITLTGSSGSGKSTLLRCLALLDARATGSIIFRGTPICGDSVPPYRRNVVYLAQSPPQFSMSVEESFRHVHTFASGRASYDADEVKHLLDELGLTSTILSRPLPQVSGGEARRLSLLRALLQAPTVLLLDEATSALDAETEACMVATLERWFDEGGRAGIAVTHGAGVWGTKGNRRMHIDGGRTIEEAAQ
ncbi:MAG: ATP-binding cassette domain-containing protein [Myxococcales bacterium]|nr:ATP-binding cassette domain-containing protein [Myxococcales bacterium]